MDALARITERVSRRGDLDDPSTPRPMLTLAEFFDGNDVDGSIGCNLPARPTPAEMRQVLEAIVARPDVGGVRVMITLFDDPEWPFSDSVFVFTTASAQAVQGWFAQDMAPDEVGEGFPSDWLLEACEVPVGMRVVHCFFD